jgi:hypothetical protein
MEDTRIDIRARLEVVLERVEIVGGTDAKIRLCLHNDEERPLWVNGRLLVNSSHAPKQYREIEIVIVDPRRVQLPFLCRVRAGQATADDYRILMPEDTLCTTVSLGECFDMTQEGAYIISAIFEDGTEHAPLCPEGSRLLRGPIHSAEKVLYVKGSKYKK